MRIARTGWIQVVVVSLSFFMVQGACAQESDKDAIDIVFRTGQGGFQDSRSDIGQLGGGQILLGMRPRPFPVTFFISGEYYTNSPDPTEPYEIDDMIGFGAHYNGALFGSGRFSYFAGASTGYLTVPAGADKPTRHVRSSHFGLESGIAARIYRGFGAYVLGKYLYARKTEAGERLVDFSEDIVLVGLSFQFSI